MVIITSKIAIETPNLYALGAGNISLWEEKDALILIIINNYLENSIVSLIQS